MGPAANGDDHSLLRAILDLVQASPRGWHGTASELLAALNARVSPEQRGPAWPSSPVGLGHRLTALDPDLEVARVSFARGIEGHANRRVIQLASDTLSSLAEEDDWQDMAETIPEPLAAWPSASNGLAGLLAMLAAIAGALLLIWLLRLPSGNLPAA